MSLSANTLQCVCVCVCVCDPTVSLSVCVCVCVCVCVREALLSCSEASECDVTALLSLRTPSAPT